MKLYFMEQGSGYGSRIYMAGDTRSSSKLYELCTTLSAWGGIDKGNDDEFWISFEFPIFHTLDFKTIIHTYVEWGEFVEWDEFIEYCAQRKKDKGL